MLGGFDPKAFGKSGVGFFRGLSDPVFHARYLAQNQDIIARSPGLILTLAGTEFTEALARGGLLRQGPFKLAGKVLEPFQRGFESALDVAGIEMKKALQHMGTSPAANAQLDAFVNEMRGLVSTARLGVSPVQRQLETLALLAPRYNRAVAALILDMGRFNLRGKLARRALIRGTAAVMAMVAAIAFAMGESEEEIASHFMPIKDGKPNPNFALLDIAGQRVGPGSKLMSVLNLITKSATNPQDLAELTAEDWMANPALRFARGNLGPVPKTSLDLITGRDFLGDPTRDGMLDLTKTVLGENLMPIWVESLLFEGGDAKGRAVRGAGEFFGLRAYVNSPIARFVEYIEETERNERPIYGIRDLIVNKIDVYAVDITKPHPNSVL